MSETKVLLDDGEAVALIAPLANGLIIAEYGAWPRR